MSYKNYKINYGNNIQKARKKAGLTQKELAQKTGIAEITIRQYENNKRTPKTETLGKIADVLGVSLGELFGKDFVKSLGHAILETWDSLDPVEEILSMETVILENFYKVNPEGRQKIYDYSEDIAANPKYQKSDNDSSSLEPEE